MKIGFTGTRKGMTDIQKELFTKLIIERNPIEFHHGDCIGADYDAHQNVSKLGIRIVIHPPIIPTYRAYCKSFNIFPPLPYMVRNRSIVNETDLLIACPKSNKEELRSGTWSTVRYARKQHKEVIIL